MQSDASCPKCSGRVYVLYLDILKVILERLKLAVFWFSAIYKRPNSREKAMLLQIPTPMWERPKWEPRLLVSSRRDTLTATWWQRICTEVCLLPEQENYHLDLKVDFLPSPTSSFASRSASDATTYSSSFLPVALMRTCLVFQNFFCMRAITELSSHGRARPPLHMSPANLRHHRRTQLPERSHTVIEYWYG